MACLHEGELGARWDWVSKNGDSATGWIACGRCGELLQRLSFAGRRFRSQGWYLGPFLQQTVSGGPVSGLEDLKVDP